ncbi:hypothetical protein AC249_AIPGENE28505 [Exaiptasia diaphana]|nr:hypothetical protein AC249_AIPGENE28505 [Exaiptasia diaphana]
MADNENRQRPAPAGVPVPAPADPPQPQGQNAEENATVQVCEKYIPKKVIDHPSNANAVSLALVINAQQTLEQRIKQLEDLGKANSVALALQILRRTLDRSKFDVEDAIADLEALVRQAKTTEDPKAREYECILDEVHKHAKTLPRHALKDLFVALVGDPVKSKVLAKSTKVLKGLKSYSEKPVPLMGSLQYQPYSSFQRSSQPRRDFSPYRRPGQRQNMRRLTCFYCDSNQHLIRDCPVKRKM